jgi:hypothetical protein
MPATSDNAIMMAVRARQACVFVCVGVLIGFSILDSKCGNQSYRRAPNYNACANVQFAVFRRFFAEFDEMMSVHQCQSDEDINQSD